VAVMTTPSPLEPDYGYQIWLGNEGCRTEDRDEPFPARGMCYLDGRCKQRVYVIPAHDLVIVRVGENARGWDEAALPNAVVRGLGGVAVAFSGGIDSTVVAKASFLALGDRAVAVTADSPSVPRAEVAEARRLALQIGINHQVVATDEFEDPNYVRNDGTRCYF